MPEVNWRGSIMGVMIYTIALILATQNLSSEFPLIGRIFLGCLASIAGSLFEDIIRRGKRDK